jgi:membrane-associated phospholipid phosphatase
MSDSIIDSRLDTPKALYISARILSMIFNPLLVPTLCTGVLLWCTTLSWLPAQTLWVTLLYTFMLTGILPLGFITALKSCGIVTHLGLHDRRQRLLPYIAGVLCYSVACVYFYRAHAPFWFNLFFAGAGAAVIVQLIVSLRWKISAHAAAMGGLLAMLIRVMLGPYVTIDLASVVLPCVIILTGAVCSARLLLGRHTLMQTVAGLINGFVCVWICTYFDPQQ